MIKSFQTIPVPEAQHGEVAAHFDQLADLSYPGFVVPAQGDENAALQAVLGAAGDRGSMVGIPAELEDYAFGWHLDSVPATDPEMDTVIHKTVHGIGRVSLLVPKPGFWRLREECGLGGFAFPSVVKELLADGKVDTELTESVVYSSNVTAGDIVVFAAGGPRPTLHEFKTVEGHRLSEIRNTSILR
jgi:hypothetical protein